MNENELTSYLLREIPVTQGLGFKIARADAQGIELIAPLELNKNHVGTAFGGSLANLLILSCYTCLFSLIHEPGAKVHVLIKEAHTKYHLPVEEDIRVHCERPRQEELDKFLQQLKRKKVAQIRLEARIVIADNKQACTFEGIFVATY